MIQRIQRFITNVRHLPARAMQLQQSLAQLDARVEELEARLESEITARGELTSRLQMRLDVQSFAATVGVLPQVFVEIGKPLNIGGTSWIELGGDVTAENVETLLKGTQSISALVIDLRGNDYWIWNAVKSLRPAVVVCRFNSLFGDFEEVTVPYSPDFSSTLAESSGRYWGSSLAALRTLAERKAYHFQMIDAASQFAFFVDQSIAAKPAEVQAQLAPHKADLQPIEGLPVFDLASCEMVPIKDLRLEAPVAPVQNLTKVSDILMQSLHGYADAAKALGQLNGLASQSAQQSSSGQ